MATISDILRHKNTHSDTSARGGTVTVAPDSTIADLASTLTDNHIGAAVVLDRGAVAGIVSERDIVRHLAHGGVLDRPVSEIMTTDVVTCGRDDALEQIAQTMTERRIRHMPVLDDGQLVGIVSIGDVVSSRIRQLEQERTQLEQYVAG